MLRKTGKEILLLFASVLLVVTSLFIPKKVDDRAELGNIGLGFPVHFVVQDSSRLAIGEPDSPPFPYRLGFISPWEYPAQSLRNNFLFSVVMT